MEILAIKWLHILSSTILFGTGIGTAFFMLVTTLRRDVHVIAAVARVVVIADMLFTATTAVIQPLTGWWLVHRYGLEWNAIWLKWSIVLYIIAMLCWLPVVWLQIRLRNVAVLADHCRRELGADYRRLFIWWVALGIPAFFAFLAIFFLMVFKPT